MANYKGSKDLTNYPEEVIPADKKMLDGEVVEMSDDDYTSRVDESCDNYDEAQKPTPPSSSEAKDRLLQKAKKDWNMDRGQVRKLLKKYAIYEFISDSNYEEAKLEVQDALNAGDITQQQNDWICDMLDGKT